MTELWQQRMDAAFDRYFAMSPMLRDDINHLFSGDDNSQSDRRNFIRAASALIEGYTNCFREMCQVGLETGRGTLNDKEVRALTDERTFSSVDRLKYTLRAVYKLFQLPSIPEFGKAGWTDAQALIEKRDKVLHPRSIEDLAVTDDLWTQLRSGLVWVFQQLFGFIEQLASVHGSKGGK